MESDPVAVALKFGFLAVLYLFLFWVPAALCASSGHGRARARADRLPFASRRARRGELRRMAGRAGGWRARRRRAVRSLRWSVDRALERRRRPDRGPLRVGDPRAHLPSRRRLLRRGHGLDERDLPQRRSPRERPEPTTSTGSGSATPSSVRTGELRDEVSEAPRRRTREHRKESAAAAGRRGK